MYLAPVPPAVIDSSIGTPGTTALLQIPPEFLVEGMQHKYRETLLFFATEAQYCYSFCTYCFRWAQFTAVGSSQQFASKDSKKLRDYLLPPSEQVGIGRHR